MKKRKCFCESDECQECMNYADYEDHQISLAEEIKFEEKMEREDDNRNK